MSHLELSLSLKFKFL